MAQKKPFPSDKEAAQMKPGHWPQEEAHNPFQTKLNKQAERVQEAAAMHNKGAAGNRISHHQMERNFHNDRNKPINKGESTTPPAGH